MWSLELDGKSDLRPIAPEPAAKLLCRFEPETFLPTSKLVLKFHQYGRVSFDPIQHTEMSQTHHTGGLDTLKELQGLFQPPTARCPQPE